MRLADRDDTKLGLTGAAIAVTAWGGTGVVIKAIDMESMSIAFYRFALYAVVVDGVDARAEAPGRRGTCSATHSPAGSASPSTWRCSSPRSS